MKKAVALRHVHFEGLGSLQPELIIHGYDVQYVDPSVEGFQFLAPQRIDLLIVLGGPIGVYDEKTYPFIVEEIDFIRRWLGTGKPILGICLGAQLIAHALGAKVYPLGVKEIGFSPIELSEAGRTSALAALEGIPVLHWHGDQFDVPEGGVHLASTLIGANQAFAIGSNVLGLQFHLEVATAEFERWLVGHACELGQAKLDPCVLRADALRFGDALASAASSVLTEWLHNHEHEA